MDSITEILGKRFKSQPPKQEKKRGGINSARADEVSQLIAFMGEGGMDQREKALPQAEGEEARRKRVNQRMRYWLGRTRKLSPAQIRDLIKSSSEGKNPQALFNWQLKQYGKQKQI